MKIEQIIALFDKEFKHQRPLFEVIKLLEGKRPLDIKTIEHLMLPSEEYNRIWYPGVYVFFGNGSPYRVGRHLTNSRLRVMQHLKAETGNATANVWDIEHAEDREVLLFNVKDRKDYHWVAALEIFLENELKEKLRIPAKRQG